MAITSTEVFELGGLLVGVLGVAFGLKQYRDARHHTVALEKLVNDGSKQLDRLQTLADSLPTRFIGGFPGNLRDLTRLVARAMNELCILCDYAGFGSFSAPASFAGYFEEIRRRRVGQPRVDVR